MIYILLFLKFKGVQVNSSNKSLFISTQGLKNLLLNFKILSDTPRMNQAKKNYFHDYSSENFFF